MNELQIRRDRKQRNGIYYDVAFNTIMQITQEINAVLRFLDEFVEDDKESINSYIVRNYSADTLYAYCAILDLQSGNLSTFSKSIRKKYNQMNHQELQPDNAETATSIYNEFYPRTFMDKYPILCQEVNKHKTELLELDFIDIRRAKKHERVF